MALECNRFITPMALWEISGRTDRWLGPYMARNSGLATVWMGAGVIRLQKYDAVARHLPITGHVRGTQRQPRDDDAMSGLHVSPPSEQASN